MFDPGQNPTHGILKPRHIMDTCNKIYIYCVVSLKYYSQIDTLISKASIFVYRAEMFVLQQAAHKWDKACRPLSSI